MSELAEGLGKKLTTLTLDGQLLTLRALNLNDLVEFEQQIGPLETKSGTVAGLRFRLYLSARRGGCGLSVEEIGGMVGLDDLERVGKALAEIEPPAPQKEDSPNAPSGPEIGPPSSGES